MKRKQKLKEQIKCLDKSLSEKWDVLDPTDSDDWFSAFSTSNCACCRKYFLEMEGCHGCPIKEDTGKKLCLGTPLGELSESVIETSSEMERIALFAREKEYLTSLKNRLQTIFSVICFLGW